MVNSVKYFLKNELTTSRDLLLVFLLEHEMSIPL
jgi:hypothetical protein